MEDLILIYWEDTIGCGWSLMEPAMARVLMKYFVGAW